MESFSGKWVSAGNVTNVEAYLKAINMVGHEDMINKRQVFEVSVNGDTMTTVTTREGEAPVTVSAKMGEKKKITVPVMGDVEVFNTFDGTTITTEQDFGKLKQTMKTRREGDKLIVDTTANGVTMTGYLQKA